MKEVKNAYSPSVKEATENLNKESAAGRNGQQPCVTEEAIEKPNEKSAAGRNVEQPCVTEYMENLDEESADGGSTSQNLHANQEMSSDLAERGKSPLAKSKKTSDEVDHFELNEFQKGRQL